MKKSMYGPLCPVWQPAVAAAVTISLALLLVGACSPSAKEEVTETTIDPSETLYELGFLGYVREFQLEDGTRCVVLTGKAIDCDWGCNGQDDGPWHN